MTPSLASIVIKADEQLVQQFQDLRQLLEQTELRKRDVGPRLRDAAIGLGLPILTVNPGCDFRLEVIQRQLHGKTPKTGMKVLLGQSSYHIIAAIYEKAYPNSKILEQVTLVETSEIDLRPTIQDLSRMAVMLKKNFDEKIFNADQEELRKIEKSGGLTHFPVTACLEAAGSHELADDEIVRDLLEHEAVPHELRSFSWEAACRKFSVPVESYGDDNHDKIEQLQPIFSKSADKINAIEQVLLTQPIAPICKIVVDENEYVVVSLVLSVESYELNKPLPAGVHIQSVSLVEAKRLNLDS